MSQIQPRNHSAIITGSARGIGRAIAIRLAKDGFDIALNDLPTSLGELEVVAESIRALGRQVIIVPGDVSNEQLVDEMVEKTVENLGYLYVVGCTFPDPFSIPIKYIT